MQQITTDQLATLSGIAIVDVREPEEYAGGHVPGAVNIPLSQLGERHGELPRDVPVHVICEAGGRSARAAEALTAAGIDAVDVAGGTSAWRTAGHPVES